MTIYWKLTITTTILIKECTKERVFYPQKFIHHRSNKNASRRQHPEWLPRIRQNGDLAYARPRSSSHSMQEHTGSMLERLLQLNHLPPGLKTMENRGNPKTGKLVSLNVLCCQDADSGGGGSHSSGSLSVRGWVVAAVLAQEQMKSS